MMNTNGRQEDMTDSLCEQVCQANADKTPLRIEGGNTKAFYGRRVEGEALSLRGHRGIVHYDPVELVITVRAGTPLTEFEAALDREHQQLSCEPPHFGDTATVGGMVATGLSGPRRPWVGAVRDFVLGTRLITWEGKSLRFGGEVMKNVAGYDLSRLMVGAQGTLGVITEVSFKVLPKAAATRCLRLEMTVEAALEWFARWGRHPLPITAAAYHDGGLYLRLEGGKSSVKATAIQLGGEALDAAFWQDLREHRLAFFNTAGESPDSRPLWRLSLPNNTQPLALDGDVLYDWAGAQRWLRSDMEPGRLREEVARAGGHATCYTQNIAEPFMPLSLTVAKYHKRLKERLDPHGIFNPGRLYAEF